jgi:GrpB-like predicted nucleotidyltransferase (UPF0157 family)
MPESAARTPMTEEQIRTATIGEPTRLAGPVVLAARDPAWPARFQREAGRVRRALGCRALRIEHVGSTAVPDLAAKPIVDALLVVADSAGEPAYVPPLTAAGYMLRIREPDWHEHRLFKGPDTDLNLHVFSAGCPEIERMLLFRDWLRANTADRQLYARTKRVLARQDWQYVQNYADQEGGYRGDCGARPRGRWPSVAQAHARPAPGLSWRPGSAAVPAAM